MLTDMKKAIFDFELKRHLLRLSLFDKIGEILKPTIKTGTPVGILYYLDFDYGKERPVTPKSS